jgi:hypothetical protein
MLLVLSSASFCFVLALRRAMFAAVMRAQFDRFGKQMIRDALEGRCLVESEAEVPVETRRIDLWVTPLEASEPSPDHLGLLGSIASRSVTLELFHNTPSGDELHLCLIKHGQFRNLLLRRKTLPPAPIQWVISSGRPEDGIQGLGFYSMPGGVCGTYECPPLFYTRLVVVSELPVTRDTLLVRLLGAGAVLKQAIAELQALPAQAPERTLALPILLELRLAVPSDPAQQTSDDQEFLMSTYPLAEAWRRAAIEEGVQQGLQQGLEQGVRQGLEQGERQGLAQGVRQGLAQGVRQGLAQGVQQGLERGVQQGVEQGERQLLLRQLRRRFGAEVDGVVEGCVAAAATEQIELWADRVLTAATLAEVLAD